MGRESSLIRSRRTSEPVQLHTVALIGRRPQRVTAVEGSDITHSNADKSVWISGCLEDSPSGLLIIISR